MQETAFLLEVVHVLEKLCIKAQKYLPTLQLDYKSMFTSNVLYSTHSTYNVFYHELMAPPWQPFQG